MLLRLIILGTVLLSAAANVAHACAAAPPRGAHVEIADESAIIIWDAANHRQHFIRRAVFTTSVEDFGFLVPTPTRPTLADAPDAAFDQLAKITAPPVLTKVVYKPSAGIGCGASAPMTASPAGNIHILEQTRVAGYDAAVLAADDPDALNRWLGEHGYESRPTLSAWLAPYIKDGWTITAFKIAKGETNIPGVAAAAVHMTFQTDRPFFPYREPEDQRATTQAQRSRRLLRVFFIGDGRFAGSRDDGNAWPGKTIWANAMREDDREQLFRSLSLGPQTAAPLWLTEFEDHSSPRPGTADVYFEPSPDRTPTERPPAIHYEYHMSWADTIFWSFVTVLIMSAAFLTVHRMLLIMRWVIRV
jgi:hypothetical protein